MELIKDGRYLMYLRKSRKDDEYTSDEDVLRRHETELRTTASRHHIVISEVYREVRSGDSISARPMMQRLLEEVSEGQWDGVLVVEIERLARGRTIDQGIVANAFQESGCLIITPSKIYDPENDMDQEYFEFSLFMSRREYKTINRRLSAGRLASSSEGRYCGSRVPIGYNKQPSPDGKGFVLIPDPASAHIVQSIFDWYVNGIPTDRGRVPVGTTAIARKLNALGYKPRYGDAFTTASVHDIICNPVYIGKIAWHKRRRLDSVDRDGSPVYRDTSKNSSPIMIFDGKHPGIVSEDLYYAAQEKRKSSIQSHSHCVDRHSNALAGVVRCGICGKSFFYRAPGSRNPKATMICSSAHCQNIGCYYDVLESKIIDAIRAYADALVAVPQPESQWLQDIQASIRAKEKEKSSLLAQLDKICESYEKGIYTDEVYLSRSQSVNSRMKEITSEIDRLKHSHQKQLLLSSQKTAIIPKMLHLVSLYWDIDDPDERNSLLKECIDHVDYVKTEKSKRGGPFDNFEITIYPKIFSTESLP